MSPRAFDSDERGAALRFTELVECPSCGVVFEGEFTDASMDVEDIVDPPTGIHQCPECHHEWTSELTGWTFYTEAG